MPRRTRGSVYPVKGGFGIRWPESGQRPHQAGFRTKTDAREWFDKHVAPRLKHGALRLAPSPEITFDEFCDLFLDRHGATVSNRTRDTLRERLVPARDVFGDWKLSELEGAANDIARWRATLTDTSRYRLTLALRQTLGAAVRWHYLTANPAVEAGRNPEPRGEELRPFTPEEIDKLAEELGAVYGPMVVFVAETGLRTNEWIALERRDLDRAGSAIVVQRRYSDGVLTPYPKTSRRRIPLTGRAVEAVEARPPRIDTPLLFPAAEGGHINLDNWRTREWYPTLDAAGISRRGPYHLRHTFATEALAAGVSIFQLARLMGTSVKMIDRTYGHLAHDSEDHLRALLDARAQRSGDEVATGEE